ncbi:sulfur carrier protein [Amycolatopsis arida]|uniref:Sulfur carrier protein n=1 Tax=Amycolatopsis arida TaxID=587909 RepID=A0A1I5QTD2_9PSEU|nr:sulfur carrier protein ThiS [Amycolatopsis arida]TDX98956.1 sulfur carrier protein [Amycolatopsis arida]SFP49519.1 sulfur carrier protein [Amycolatopsis arida]
MEIHVNGEEREFADGSTLAQVLDELGANQRGIAVAVDDEVVPRAEWAERSLTPGARLEVLTAVQGG